MTALRGIAGWWPGVTILGVIIGVDLVWQKVPPLVAFDEFLSAHRSGLLTLTITMAIVGVAGLVGGWAHGLITEGQRAPDEELRSGSDFNPEFAGSGGAPRGGFQAYRFWGKAAAVSFQETDSFSEIKQAWRDGSWLHSAPYIRVTVMIASLFVLLLGGFGIPVVAPSVMGIKVVMIAAIIYSFARFGWGMSRA
jgi:hypothetical protein